MWLVEVLHIVASSSHWKLTLIQISVNVANFEPFYRLVQIWATISTVLTLLVELLDTAMLWEVPNDLSLLLSAILSNVCNTCWALINICWSIVIVNQNVLSRSIQTRLMRKLVVLIFTHCTFPCSTDTLLAVLLIGEFLACLRSLFCKNRIARFSVLRYVLLLNGVSIFWSDHGVICQWWRYNCRGFPLE